MKKKTKINSKPANGTNLLLCAVNYHELFKNNVWKLIAESRQRLGSLSGGNSPIKSGISS
ncbi:MAG: hypothetical protein JSS93_09740 [Bacteroidetes bacterium]|jgi:hypothetical protein|nr:hypothetical protein [Bacteroidota bacterium]